jgi:hypothetical protein
LAHGRLLIRAGLGSHASNAGSSELRTNGASSGQSTQLPANRTYGSEKPRGKERLLTAAQKRELTGYFEDRLKKLGIVEITKTPSQQPEIGGPHDYGATAQTVKVLLAFPHFTVALSGTESRLSAISKYTAKCSKHTIFHKVGPEWARRKARTCFCHTTPLISWQSNTSLNALLSRYLGRYRLGFPRPRALLRSTSIRSGTLSRENCRSCRGTMALLDGRGDLAPAMQARMSGVQAGTFSGSTLEPIFRAGELEQ